MMVMKPGLYPILGHFPPYKGIQEAVLGGL
jgi:hypothetical protein